MVRRMRVFWVVCVVLVAGCGSRNQALVAPCVGKPATGSLGDCPSCTTDADCKVLSNPCEPSAYCVHKDSSWMVNSQRTCSEQQLYTPNLMSCRCLGNICDWHQ